MAIKSTASTKAGAAPDVTPEPATPPIPESQNDPVDEAQSEPELEPEAAPDATPEQAPEVEPEAEADVEARATAINAALAAGLIPMLHPDGGTCDAYAVDHDGNILVPASDAATMFNHGFVVVAR